MGTRAAFVTGTVLSFSVPSAWSCTAALTIGPAAPLHLGRDLPADFAQLAAAPTGNGTGLFAVLAAIYTLCFFVSGLRRIRRAQRETSREPRYHADDVEATAASGRWS